MAYNAIDELRYVVNDYYDVDDEFAEIPFERAAGGRPDCPRVEEEVEDDDYIDADLSKQTTDTSAVEARNGKDIQGIPWERMNFTRDRYRETRLKQYKNFESLSQSRVHLRKEFKKVEKGSTFYDFQFNTRLVKSTVVHFQVAGFLLRLWFEFIKKIKSSRDVVFGYVGSVPCPFYYSLKVVVAKLTKDWQVQSMGRMWNIYELIFCPQKTLLRNLLSATSKHDVYLMQNYSIMHWSSLLRKGTEVLNVARPIVPPQKSLGCLPQGMARIQITTMAVKDNLLVAGGFRGELVCKFLNRAGVSFCTKLTNDDNAITNCADICHTPNGSIRIMTANNDACVRIFDTESFSIQGHFCFPWCVNNTSVSLDGKLLAVLGDSTDCLLADSQTGKPIGSLKGHLDYSFASAWHPDGYVLATGNQDTTCRLWDIRNLSTPLAVLEGRMGAIRAIKFTSDGRFMAAAEAADFIHVFDVASDYTMSQEIDLFGEVAGISFSPDAESLFVGVADRTYGSLLEFKRSRSRYYMDSFL